METKSGGMERRRKLQVRKRTQCLPQHISQVSELQPQDPLTPANHFFRKCVQRNKWVPDQTAFYHDLLDVSRQMKYGNVDKMKKIEILRLQTNSLKEYLSGRRQITAHLDIGAELDELIDHVMYPGTIDIRGSKIYTTAGIPYAIDEVVYTDAGTVYDADGDFIGYYSLLYGPDGMGYNPVGKPVRYKKVVLGPGNVVYGHDGKEYSLQEVDFGLDGLVYTFDNCIIGSFDINYGPDGMAYDPTGEPIGYKLVVYGPDVVYGHDDETYDINEITHGSNCIVYGPNQEIIGGYNLMYGPDGMGYKPNGQAVGYKRVRHAPNGIVYGHDGQKYDVGDLRYGRDGLVYGPIGQIIGSHKGYQRMKSVSDEGSYSYRSCDVSSAYSSVSRISSMVRQTITESETAMDVETFSTVDMSSATSATFRRQSSCESIEVEEEIKPPPPRKSMKPHVKSLIMLYKMGRKATKDARTDPLLLPGGRIAVDHKQLGLLGVGNLRGCRSFDIINTDLPVACESFYDHEIYTRCDADDDPVNYSILHIDPMSKLDFLSQESFIAEIGRDLRST